MKNLEVIERVLSTAWQAGLGALAASAEAVTAHSSDWRTGAIFVAVTVVAALVKNLAVQASTKLAPVETELKTFAPVLHAVEAVPAVKAEVAKVEANPVVQDVVKDVAPTVLTFTPTV